MDRYFITDEMRALEEEELVRRQNYNAALSILGQRVNYISYSKSRSAYYGRCTHMAKILRFSYGNLGIEVATKLAEMIPETMKAGSSIWCEDIITPYSIDEHMVRENDGTWRFNEAGDPRSEFLFQDGKFLVYISRWRENKNKICVSIFKK